MATAIGILLLALPFVVVGGVVATLTYVLGTPRSENVDSLARNGRRSPPLTHASGTRTDASAAFAAVVASSLRRAISSTIAVV